MSRSTPPRSPDGLVPDTQVPDIPVPGRPGAAAAAAGPGGTGGTGGTGGPRAASLLAPGSPGRAKIDLVPIRPALTGRDWTLRPGVGVRTAAAARPSPGGRLHHAVLVTGGQGHLIGSERPCGFTGPALVWVPPGGAERLHMRAGATGWLLGLADDLLAGTIGTHVEAVALSALAGRLLAVPVASVEVAADLSHSFAAIWRELGDGDRGSWTAVTAHVALVMVGLWRASGIEAAAGRSGGPAAAILQRFRHLVELHFRDHWRLPRYAAALAVSPDRLAAVCMRELGRTPLALVHDRLTREAMRLLEHSMLTVEQIAGRLGFKDPAHFNRFFKARTGVPPGAFRREVARSASRRSPAQPHHSYADWP